MRCREILHLHVFSCSFRSCGRILEMHQRRDETLEGAKLMCDVSVCSRPSSSSSSSSSCSHIRQHTHSHTLLVSLLQFKKNNPNWASLSLSSDCSQRHVRLLSRTSESSTRDLVLTNVMFQLNC